MDISSHQSQPVTEALIQQFDLVLTMERQQKEGLILQFKPYAKRIYMLSEMVNRVEDVPDPIGGELTDYQVTVNMLNRFLSAGLTKIHQLALKPHSKSTI